MKTLRVLAPVEKDPRPLAALLLPLATARPIHVTLFHLGEESDILRTAARIFRSYGIDADTQAGRGVPAEEIAAFASTRRFDLLAMISHGRRGLRRALAGSVAERVLRHTKIPLLLAHRDCKVTPWRLVAAAVDGSPDAERVLDWAGAQAKAAGTPLHLLRVHPPGGARNAGAETDLLRRRLARRGIESLPFLRQGLPTPQILRYAKEVGPSLLCLTTHGRDGLRRWALGSVAEEVARRAPCPVLIAHA